MVRDATTVCFRVDANRNIGMGHLARCLAIAELIQDEMPVVFILKQTDEAYLEYIKQAHFSYCFLDCIDVDDECHQINQTLDNILLVVDGYQFDSHYQATIKNLGITLFVVDDKHQGQFYADLVLNHAPHLNPSVYQCEPHTTLCLGLAYAMVRKDFLRHAHQPRLIQAIDEVCLCFGGTEQSALIQQIVEQLIAVSELKAIHVIYANRTNGQKGELLNDKRVSIHTHLNSSEMANLMRQCQVMICPASTISIEAFMMKMIIITGLTADNQQDIHAGITQYESVKSIGDFRAFCPNKLSILLTDIINMPPQQIEPALKTHKLKSLFGEYIRKENHASKL